MLLPPPPSPSAPSSASNELMHCVTLENGLRLEFYDRSNRYFGDYHRICIEVQTSLPLSPPPLVAIDAALLARAQSRFGTTLTVSRTLERMGVASAEVAALKAELVEAFLREARRYQARPDYPARLIGAELGRKPTAGTWLKR